MKQAQPSSEVTDAQRQAIASSNIGESVAPVFSDHRQEAVVQRRLCESIQQSPVLAAQRQQLTRITGQADPLLELSEEDAPTTIGEGEVAQRASAGEDGVLPPPLDTQSTTPSRYSRSAGLLPSSLYARPQESPEPAAIQYTDTFPQPIQRAVLTRGQVRNAIGDCETVEDLVAFLRVERPNFDDAAITAAFQLWLEGHAAEGADADEILNAAGLLEGAAVEDGGGVQWLADDDAPEEALNEVWHEGGGNDPLDPGEYDPEEDLEDDYRAEVFPAVAPMQVGGGGGEDVVMKVPMQFARPGNTVSGPKDYQTSDHGKFKNVAYKTKGDGNIDFDDPYKKTKWKDPIKGAKVNLQKGVKKAGYMAMATQIIKIRGATRGQHFAVANRIKGYPDGQNSPDDYTWHHLSDFPYMILVDRIVHSKHGHNGGIHLW